MPGFVPPPHPAATSQGNAPQFSKMAGLFWPQGDPGKLRQAAQAWREMGSALTAAEGTSHGAANLVVGSNEGPAIDAFSRYWSKWEGGNGYFELSYQSCGQMAEALERYATAIDQARQRVEEIAVTAATVLAVGVVLTVVSFGLSDVAAAGGAAALTAAAAAVGVDLSATVASIGGTILAGAAIGAAASTLVDTAIQIEHIDVFHDQKSFNWDELEHSLEIGALTGGAGAGVGLGARAVAPMLEDGLPGLSQAANAFGKMPQWMQSGVRGTLVGGGMAAGIDELTTGQVNPLDVALGATSATLGDVVAGRAAPPGGATTDVSGPASGGGRIFVTTPNGYTIPVPADFAARVADNGQGLVYQQVGAGANTNMIRIMDPTPQYPDGYVRYYNGVGGGQPLDAAGNPGSRAATHLPLSGGPIPGYYQWLERFMR
jgi:hypothetical protein